MKCFVVLLLGAAMSVSLAASSSRACSFVGGVMRCVDNDDPNGNSAVAFSGSNGPPQVYAGQGYPGNFNFAPFNGFPNGYFPFQQPQFQTYGKKR